VRQQFFSVAEAKIVYYEYTYALLDDFRHENHPPRPTRNILFYFSTPKISLMRGGVTKKLYKSTILVSRTTLRHFALNIPLT
jgi:hypothetical protein